MNRVSIQLKILAGIVFILLISISLSIVISVVNQRNALLDNSQRDIRGTNEILNTVIKNIMLDGKAPLAVSTMKDLQQISGIDQLQIYRTDGTVAFSDYSTMDFVNQFQDMIMFDRTPRQDNMPESEKAFRLAATESVAQVVEDIPGRRLEFFFPILNTTECRVCHGGDHLVRGVAYYRVSLDRVFQQINRSRNTLILFFAATGGIIALVLFTLMRQVVIRPVQSLGAVVQTVGQGNLEVSANVTTRDEFGLLSDQLNAMIAGLKEKNRLEIKNSIIDTRNRENQKYLDNIGEGLLLIGRDRRISPQYSRFLTGLFGVEDISGQRLEEFIYPLDEVDSERRRELGDFVDVIFDSVTTEMEMIMSINPLQNLELQLEGGGESRRIIIDAAFYRIMEDDEVENVMVIFTDRTGIVEVQEELQRERRRSDAELSQIAAVLKIGAESFEEFVDEARSLFSRLEGIADGQVTGSAGLSAAARDLHSLKGTARYLNFSAIAESIHQLEEVFPKYGEEADLAEMSGGEPDDYSGFRSALERLETELNAIEDIKARFRSFTRREEGGGSRDNLLEFREAVDQMIAGLAAEGEKKVVSSFRGNIRHLPRFRSLRPLLIHLVRNAIDHGIEERFERIAAGKSEEGHLEFIFSKKDGLYKIIVADDGRGIDFDAVRRRAEELGIIRSDAGMDDGAVLSAGGPEKEREAGPSRDELIRILFSPRFSTRRESTEVSGRGIGLDAVQKAVQSLGGRISVYTKAGEGTHFTITLPAAEGEEL